VSLRFEAVDVRQGAADWTGELELFGVAIARSVTGTRPWPRRRLPWPTAAIRGGKVYSSVLIHPRWTTCPFARPEDSTR
jgi:hypothetical protein